MFPSRFQQAISRGLFLHKTLTVKEMRRVILQRGQQFLRSRPLVANSLALGVLYASAEVSQQWLNHFFRHNVVAYHDFKEI